VCFCVHKCAHMRVCVYCRNSMIIYMPTDASWQPGANFSEAYSNLVCREVWREAALKSRM